MVHKSHPNIRDKFLELIHGQFHGIGGFLQWIRGVLSRNDHHNLTGLVRFIAFDVGFVVERNSHSTLLIMDLGGGALARSAAIICAALIIRNISSSVKPLVSIPLRTSSIVLFFKKEATWSITVSI